VPNLKKDGRAMGLRRVRKGKKESSDVQPSVAINTRGGQRGGELPEKGKILKRPKKRTG